MEVAAWREREAQSRNVPRGRILKDEAVIDIATSAPRSVEALGRLRTIPAAGSSARAPAPTFLAAVERGLSRDPASVPTPERGRPRPQRRQRRAGRAPQGAAHGRSARGARRAQDHRHRGRPRGPGRGRRRRRAGAARLAPRPVRREGAGPQGRPLALSAEGGRVWCASCRTPEREPRGTGSARPFFHAASAGGRCGSPAARSAAPPPAPSRRSAPPRRSGRDAAH